MQYSTIRNPLSFKVNMFVIAHPGLISWFTLVFETFRGSESCHKLLMK